MHNIIKARCVASKEKLLAVSGLLSGAIIWGLIWYPYRLLEQMGISGALSSFATYLIPLLLGFTLYSERLRLRHFPPILLLIGLTAGWTNLAYVLAVIDGEVMRVLLLFYLSPLWTVLLARLLLHERLRFHGYLVMALSFAGAVVMLWRPSLGLPLPQNTAEWMALSAGLTFAATNVLSRRAEASDIWLKSLSVWIGVSVLSLLALIYQPATLACFAGVACFRMDVAAARQHPDFYRDSDRAIRPGSGACQSGDRDFPVRAGGGGVSELPSRRRSDDGPGMAGRHDDRRRQPVFRQAGA